LHRTRPQEFSTLPVCAGARQVSLVVRRRRAHRMDDDAAVREQLLRRAYPPFNPRATAAPLAATWPGADRPQGLGGGEVYGHDQVRAYRARQWGVLNSRVEPLGFTHGGGEVVVDVHQVVRDCSGAVVVDAVVRHAYRFVGSLVKGMEIRSPDAEPGAAPD